MSTTLPMPDVDPEQADAGLNLHHLVMYYVIRPTVKQLPVRVFAALAMLGALLVGAWRAVRHRDYYRRILNACGRNDSLRARVRVAVLAAYAKARHLEWYIYERTNSLQATWDGEPETEPCLYFLANTYGSEAISTWMDRYPGVMVRRTFAGEGQFNPDTASPPQMWRAHQAKLRENAARCRQLVVGDNPMAYRKLFAGRQSIIIYQDLWDPKKHDGPMFLGVPATLLAGGLRIARLAGGLPLRFMTITPNGPHWRVHVGPRLPATYETIAAAVESDIRARPAEWMLWREWFEHIDTRP